MSLSKNQILSILGLGLIIGCFASILNLPQLIMLGTGFGILVGGIFREIKSSTNSCKNDELSQQVKLSRGKIILMIAVMLVAAIQTFLLFYYLK